MLDQHACNDSGRVDVDIAPIPNMRVQAECSLVLMPSGNKDSNQSRVKIPV